MAIQKRKPAIHLIVKYPPYTIRQKLTIRHIGFFFLVSSYHLGSFDPVIRLICHSFIFPLGIEAPTVQVSSSTRRGADRAVQILCAQSQIGYPTQVHTRREDPRSPQRLSSRGHIERPMPAGRNQASLLLLLDQGVHGGGKERLARDSIRDATRQEKPSNESFVIPERVATWAALAYVVVAGSIAVFLLLVYVIQRWTASRAADVVVVIPIVTVLLVTVLLSAWLDDEPVRTGLITGGLLVLTGVYVGALRRPNAA
jgi:hypothetical protein